MDKLQAAKTLLETIENPPEHATNEDLRVLLALSSTIINLMSRPSTPAEVRTVSMPLCKRPEFNTKPRLVDEFNTKPQVPQQQPKNINSSKKPHHSVAKASTRPAKVGHSVVTLGDGTVEYYLNGVLHRENDRPAIEYANGDLEWWYNGERHRAYDRPAVVYTNGLHKWYIAGEMKRRGDGPVAIDAYGKKTY